MLKFPEHADVIAGGDALWEAACRLDVRLQGALQQLVHLTVVVIIVPVRRNFLDAIFQNNILETLGIKRTKLIQKLIS